jgi:hypothetical protein
VRVIAVKVARVDDTGRAELCSAVMLWVLAVWRRNHGKYGGVGLGRVGLARGWNNFGTIHDSVFHVTGAAAAGERGAGPGTGARAFTGGLRA